MDPLTDTTDKETIR